MSTMIQNPNEIEAFTRRQRALARIHRNIAEKFQLNRRQFISGSLATMALAALGLSGCAPKTPAASTGDAAPAFTPGTYEATAQGRNGEIKVSVTFEADRIASIEADHMESRNIGDAAVRLLTDNYLDTQKLSVDTVTGATLTSMAFATAVAECAEAAGADMRAIMKGDASVNAAEPITDEADVVVIGSGGAALAAAVTAAEAGKSVVMLEKMDIYGGNTNAGEGTLNAPDPERQEPMGIEDSPDFYYTQTFEGGDSAGDPALVRILADNALDAVHWMEDHGLIYEKEVFTAIGGLWQRGHAVEVERKGEQGGSYYVSCLMDAAQATGNFTLYTDAKIEELIVEGGAVVGVRGTRPSSGEAVEVRGKSVVLATGGYSRNAELAMQYDKRVTESMPSSNVCSSTGDGLALAEAAGAGLRNMELVQIHPLGDPQNGGVATFVGNWLGVEDYVMVNDDAVRFVREDERRDTIADAILEQPNDEMWLLVDSTNIKDDRLEEIADLVAKGHSFKADTIEDLATQIGVDPSTLAETIEGYNACVAAGKDTQIAPGKELLGDAVSDPSFYASKRIPTIHYTMGGVCISPEAQVLTAAGEAIPGLFAAGEVTGGVQGANRLGGNSLAETVVSGRYIGSKMVEYLKGSESVFKTEPVNDARKLVAKTIDDIISCRNGKENCFDLRNAMQDVMMDDVGIFRNAKDLQNGVDRLLELSERAKHIGLHGSVKGFTPELSMALRVPGMIKLALCTAYGALQRTESRGAHTREDFPARNDAEWLTRTLAYWKEGDSLPTLKYEDASPWFELPPGERGYGGGKIIPAEIPADKIKTKEQAEEAIK